MEKSPKKTNNSLIEYVFLTNLFFFFNFFRRFVLWPHPLFDMGDTFFKLVGAFLVLSMQGSRLQVDRVFFFFGFIASGKCPGTSADQISPWITQLGNWDTRARAVGYGSLS